MIIQRPEEVKRIEESGKWVLVYGRRKTGKSFLVENFISYDSYFFVNRDRSILSKKGNNIIGYEAFTELMKRDLDEGKCVVVDEFHRLGDGFFDLLHAMKKRGKLIALTSTLFLAKRLVSAGSPLLGLFNEIQVPLIILHDSMNSLGGYSLDNKELLEAAIMLREPIAIEYFNEKQSVRVSMANAIIGSKNAVPALIGEIFQEEERSLSATYEGIIRAVANGNVVSGEMSNLLFSRKLIPKNDPSAIQPYLKSLVNIGMLKRVGIYGKNKFAYKIASPLARMFFYADEKYGITTRDITLKEAYRVVEEMMPHIVEDSVREFLADRFGLAEMVFEAKDYGVDGVLLKFKKPAVILEVKWGEQLDGSTAKAVKENLNRIEAGRKILFVRDKGNLKIEGIEVLDTSDLMKISSYHH